MAGHIRANSHIHFHLKPPPKVDVRVCTDMSCHLLGATQVRHSLEKAFPSQQQSEISIRPVSCLGRCDNAPALSINDHIFAGVGPGQALEMVLEATEGRAARVPPRDHRPQHLTTDPYTGPSTYKAVRQFVESRDYKSVLSILKASGLRGMGGAGFPTGTKWEIVRNAPGAQKYIVCNADESEPGTIKDRFLMEHVPHLVIEGMIVAGLVTGATKGILYIRHEYEEPREVLQEEIQRCYREKLVGRGILGSELDFDLEIFVSPGGYICGEESALIEAIKGHRAEPRNKPPFPGQIGLWQKPTVINNVETFINVPQILARGVDWFVAQGAGGSRGLKFVGVSGHVARPGIFEVPMGMPMRDVIFNHAGGVRGGKQLK